jgi:glucosyl-dolichyl phosphate glucuronosyltransferase
MASALCSVCEQTLDPSRYEIIVVDNNSTDSTKQHVVNVSRQYSHVRYCFVEEQGLSYARNAGCREAQGQYVAYIDDDCTVAKDWLSMAQEVIEQVSPAMFGGPYRPFYKTTKPRWYRDSYGSYDMGPVARALAPNEFLCGTNMFFHRRVLERLGGFNTEVGMVGERLGYGEETVVQLRIGREHPEEIIYYDPRLIVHHLVRSEKMRILWCARQMFASGRDWQRVLDETAQARVHTPLRSCARVGRAVFSLVKGFIHGAVVRDRSRYPFVANYLYEVVFVQLQALGAAYEQLTHRSS